MNLKKEDIIKFYYAHQLQIFPVIVVLASLFLIMFVIYPQVVRLISNQQTIGDLNKRSNFLGSKAVALENYNEQGLSNKVGFVLTTLPVEKDYGNVLDLMQQLTAQFGFNVDSISFGGSSIKQGELGSFAIQLDVKGPRAMFQDLLSALENSFRLVRVNSIDITSKQDSQIFSASLGLDALYSELPKDFGNTDSPLPDLSQKDEELIVKLEDLMRSIPSSASAIESPRGKSNPFE